MSSEIPPNSRTVDLTKGSVRIGRASAKDTDRTAKLSNLYIRNSHLSKFHARIWESEGKVYLQDVSSTFGTVWNNNLLAAGTEVELSTGDSIGFVINRPSFVIRNLYLKSKPPQMLPLDKLLNPRVQLRFDVHALAPSQIVLLPADEPTSEASCDLNPQYDDVTYVENTPDAPNPIVVDLDEEDKAEVDAEQDSDDEAPEEDRIVKEVTEIVEPVAKVRTEEVQEAAEAEDQVEVEEELAEEEEEGEDEEEEGEDEEEEEEEEEVEEDYEVESEEAEDRDVNDEQDLTGFYAKSSIAAEEQICNDDDDHTYVYMDVSEEECGDCGDSGEYDVSGKCDDEKEEEMQCNTDYRIFDCEVPGIKYFFESDYDSDVDETYHFGAEVHAEESERETPSADECEIEQLCLSDSFSDGETVSECDSPRIEESDFSEDETFASECHCDEPVEELVKLKDIIEFEPLAAAPLTTAEPLSGMKRSYDEAELEEEVPDDTPAPPANKKRSLPASILKEVGKGALYVFGTVVAIAAYGGYLEHQQ